jgi:hypothetical protein
MHRFKRLPEVALASVSSRKLACPAAINSCRKFVSVRLGTAQWSWVTRWRPAKPVQSCIKTHETTSRSRPKSLFSRPKRWLKPLLIPLRRVIIQKLTVPQLVKKFPVFYETQTFTSVFSPPHVPVVRHTTPVHTCATDFYKIHLNIIFPSTPGSSKWYLSFGLPSQTLYEPLFSPTRATWPAHLIFLDFITRILFCEQKTVRYVWNVHNVLQYVRVAWDLKTTSRSTHTCHVSIARSSAP